MSLMKFAFAILILTALPARAADCAGRLKAINIWEDEIDGQIVTKNTQFPLSGWDPNATFDGVILSADDSKNLKAPILEVEYRSKSGSKKKLETFKDAKPFDQDATVKMFEDFKPKEFFTIRQAGSYSLKLKDGNTVICTESHTYSLGH